MAQEQPFPTSFGRLAGDVDPKAGPKGLCDLLENTQSLMVTEGPGVTIEKRPASPSLSRDILGGGSLSVGAKLAAYGSELLATDGGVLYSWSPGLTKWVKKGFVTDLAVYMAEIIGNADTGEVLSNVLLDTDVAYANGYACYVASRDPVFLASGVMPAHWYVKELATGNIVGNGSLNAGTDCVNARVVAVGTDFYLFYWDGVNTLGCRKIATATAPSTLGSHTSVATNVNTDGIYDVIADATGTRILLAYHNTTPTLTLMVWTTGMAAGTTQAYATENPNRCIGFLDWTMAGGNGYVAIGTSVNGVRVLTFSTSTLVVATNAAVDAAATDAVACTGYFSTVRNVLYTRPGTGTATGNDVTLGWSDGTGFVAMRGMTLQGRPFSVDGGKRYVPAGHWEINNLLVTNRSLFLLELDLNATTRGGVRVAALLANGDWGVWAMRRKGLGAVAVVSSTVALVSSGGLTGPTAATSGGTGLPLRSYTVDFSRTLTGAPATFNGGAHFPCAAAKVYDGRTVFEHGFYMRPGKPILSQAGGGSHTAGVVQVKAIYSQIDNTGILWRSSESDVASITMTAGNSLTIAVPSLRATDRTPLHAIDSGLITPQVKVEFYSTRPGGTSFTLTGQILNNDASVDTVEQFEAGDNPGTGEAIYTSTNEADNFSPAMVLAFEAHRDRLFAITGDGALFFTKDIQSGKAAQFAADTDGFFLEFDVAAGPLVGVASDGTTLFVAQRSKIYLVQGDGPNLDGSDGYSYPQPLPAQAGFRVPRGFVATPDGILVDTAKGKHMLDRAGGLQPIPGADAYDSLTVTGGVTLDDRTMAVLTTSEGRSLCWDWQLKTWHTWTGQPAVACCRWQNKFVWLESNGKVHVETPGAYTEDSAGAIAMTVQLVWLDMLHAYLKRVEVIGEAMASCTLQVVTAFNYDDAGASTKSLALTTSGPKAPWILEPDEGYMESLHLKLTESSTTRGVKLSKLVAWAALLPGSDKHAAASYFG